MTALTPLDELWLTETVRLREEHAGALEDEEANRRARAAAGDLQTRIKHRALWLAERDGMLKALHHWKQGARLALILLAVVRGGQRRRTGVRCAGRRTDARSMCSGRWAACSG